MYDSVKFPRACFFRQNKLFIAGYLLTQHEVIVMVACLFAHTAPFSSIKSNMKILCTAVNKNKKGKMDTVK